jgi:hypothetical protein
VPEQRVWLLEDFLEKLDIWVKLEQPSDDLCLTVTAWILSRTDDPYQGVSRESGFPNLWFGVVPDSRDDEGRVVTCSYWIEELRHTVRCDSFATLSPPL